MEDDVPTVMVIDSEHHVIEEENATYLQAAKFVVDHPRREFLRVKGDGIDDSMSADDFLRWTAHPH